MAVTVEELSLQHKKLVCTTLEETYLAQPLYGSESSFITCFTNRKHKPIFLLQAEGKPVAFLRLLPGTPRKFVVFGDPIQRVNPSRLIQMCADIVGFERVTHAVAKQLEDMGFSPKHDRDIDDYVYQLKDLAELPGNKFSKKRAWVTKALEEYKGRIATEDISASNIDQCISLLKHWCDKRNCMLNHSMCSEFQATMEALTHWSDLSPQIFGIAILIDKKVEAFCVGERISPDTAVCHFEKANADFVGMAQLINKLFAERLQTSFTYVNREEDCGSSGLRQAKQSYQPTKMVEKFNVDLPQRLEAASCMETETTRKCDASPNDWQEKIIVDHFGIPQDHCGSFRITARASSSPFM